MSEKVLEPKKSPHYLVLTGLQFVESGGEGRRLQVVACIRPGEDQAMPEVAGSFLAADNEIPHGLNEGEARPPIQAACQICEEPHAYYGLMEALEDRMLPVGCDGSGAVSVELPDLVSVTLGWRRTTSKPSLKRVAS